MEFEAEKKFWYGSFHLLHHTYSFCILKAVVDGNWKTFSSFLLLLFALVGHTNGLKKKLPASVPNNIFGVRVELGLGGILLQSGQILV